MNTYVPFETETHTSNLWTDDYESVLEAIRINSVVLGNAHKKRYLYLRHILQYFRIPVIIFNGINSVCSVGLQPYVRQETISVITCIIALVCGVIGSIELYLSINTQIQNELVMSKEFYTLAVEIFKVLSLQRDHRSNEGKAFLEEKFSVYIKLIENSNVLTKAVQDKLAPLPIHSNQSVPSVSSNESDVSTP